MIELPADCLTPGPPFSSVYLDVVGPWTVSARRTRRSLAHCKKCAALFTCSNSRAIQIEIFEGMSVSPFVKALRRFISLRDPGKEIRSDTGTTFLGAMDANQAEAIYTEKGPVHIYLNDHNIS